MPRLDVNFNDVPDAILPIGPGSYDLAINEAPTIEAAKSGKGNMVVTKFVVASEGEFKGRMITHRFCIWTSMGKVDLKRCYLSAGVLVGAVGANTEDLVGKVVKAIIGTRKYKDETTGEEREASEIKKFLIPGDA